MTPLLSPGIRGSVSGIMGRSQEVRARVFMALSSFRLRFLQVESVFLFLSSLVLSYALLNWECVRDSRKKERKMKEVSR